MARFYRALVEDMIPVLVSLSEAEEKSAKGDVYWPTSTFSSRGFVDTGARGCTVSVCLLSE
eukprot:CAMPEP_0119143874 /NCGR_PEP_ID=MMETSP1310-20130426/34992_1 /TAXON_ID=464262 /ORGANISM="Genus nov. species nov., Strain RCC2339" /LENGTH=60 /DNA_ID=CAMNT_0007135539 /DNA_START=38 /DNA_END=217 /DNA_ORIENTATION=-